MRSLEVDGWGGGLLELVGEQSPMLAKKEEGNEFLHPAKMAKRLLLDGLLNMHEQVRRKARQCYAIYVQNERKFRKRRTTKNLIQRLTPDHQIHRCEQMLLPTFNEVIGCYRQTVRRFLCPLRHHTNLLSQPHELMD
jgi:hypothetical protein